MIRKFLIIFLIIFNISYSIENQIHLKRLLTIIQGSFKDKVYTITIQKAKEYLKLAPKDDKYKDEVAKILAYSFIKSKKKNISELLSFLESINLSKQTKEYIYSLILQNTKDTNIKKHILKKLYFLTKEKSYLIKLASILYKNQNFKELLSLPSIKEINIYKVVAIYKLKDYKKLVEFTEKMSKFPIENKDEVLYYRGIALIKIGKKEKGIKTLEAITFKTPKIIKFLANFYIKNGKYLFAEKYLKMLYLEEKEKAYALFYLGYVNEKQKDFQKAYEYYKKLLNLKESKFKPLAMQRIIYLKSIKAISKETIYSIRVILYKSQKRAKRFIKEKGLKECFIYPYKKFIGVYCGVFYNKTSAKEYKEKLKEKLKIKDVSIQKLNL